MTCPLMQLGIISYYIPLQIFSVICVSNPFLQALNGVEPAIQFNPIFWGGWEYTINFFFKCFFI